MTGRKPFLDARAKRKLRDRGDICVTPLFMLDGWKTEFREMRYAGLANRLQPMGRRFLRGAFEGVEGREVQIPINLLGSCRCLNHRVKLGCSSMSQS